MTKTEALRGFLSDDEILDVVILYKSRKMEAAKNLASLMFPKWQISTLEAVNILEEVSKEFK